MGRRKNKVYEDKEKESKSKKIWRNLALILFLIMIFVYYQVYVLYRYTMGKKVTERQMMVYKWMTNLVNSSEETETSNENSFMEIGIAGGIYIPKSLITSSINNEESSFNSIFKNALVNEYDYTIGSLNTCVLNKTSYNKLCSPEILMKELNKVGFDLLVLATENLAKSDNSDVKSTIQNIKKNGLSYVGTKNDNNYYILKKDNIKIGILAYVGDEYSKQENELINVYSEKKLETDLKSIKDEKVDAVILFIDTLRSNSDRTGKDKKQLLQKMLDKKINIIISNDSIIQKNYEEDDGYIEYSLGNFIGAQSEEKSDISKVLKVTIEKNANKKQSTVNISVKQDKVFVALSNSDGSKYKIVDLDKELDSYNENRTGSITQAEYNYLKEIKENYDN